MAKHSRTWWGQKFISAIESFTDSGRLQRGRAYSGDSRIIHFTTKGVVTATIRGNVNKQWLGRADLPPDLSHNKK